MVRKHIANLAQHIPETEEPDPEISPEPEEGPIEGASVRQEDLFVIEMEVTKREEVVVLPVTGAYVAKKAAIDADQILVVFTLQSGVDRHFLLNREEWDALVEKGTEHFAEDPSKKS